MKTYQNKIYNTKKHNLNPVVKVVKTFFGDNLQAIFVHGSLFDGTFGKYSDYDVVIILESISEDVFMRDDFAQKLKIRLKDNWRKNPCSFDFYSVDEFRRSAEIGHPFVKSILNKGCPFFDPKGIFEFCSNSLPSQINSQAEKQMIKNLSFLADRYFEIAKKLLDNNDFQFALLNISTAMTFIIRACLIKEGYNIYQGEIYQFFLRIFKDKIPTTLANDLWKYAFKANQISFRLKEPHVDVPLQNTADLFKKINNAKLVVKLIGLYGKLKKI